MASTELSLSPTAVALHTRDREDDYRWLFEVGQFSVADLLKQMHRELIADRSAHPATSLIFLDRGDVLGLVVANLKSQRRDHSQTLIEDTLLAEFGPGQRKDLLLAVASLIDPSTADCQSRILDYAEGFFQAGTGRPSAGTFCIPAAPGEADDGLSRERRVAVRSNDTNLRRVASLLRFAAETPDVLGRPFLLVSTGFVGLESLERFTTLSEQFVALSRSSSLPDTGVLPLKKKVLRRPWMFSMASVAAGVGGICLISLLIYRGISSTNSPESPNSRNVLPNSNVRTLGSVRNSPGEHGRSDALNQASRAAAAVGLAGPADRWTNLAAIPMLMSDMPVGITAIPDTRPK